MTFERAKISTSEVKIMKGGGVVKFIDIILAFCEEKKIKYWMVLVYRHKKLKKCYIT